MTHFYLQAMNSFHNRNIISGARTSDKKFKTKTVAARTNEKFSLEIKKTNIKNSKI